VNNFIIEHDQLEKIAQWMIDHECSITHVGAIGGKTSYIFTPTGIGTVIKARCACGSEVDVTDYEDW
jgi:hypothetical protein